MRRDLPQPSPPPSASPYTMHQLSTPANQTSATSFRTETLHRNKHPCRIFDVLLDLQEHSQQTPSRGQKL